MGCFLSYFGEKQEPQTVAESHEIQFDMISLSIPQRSQLSHEIQFDMMPISITQRSQLEIGTPIFVHNGISINQCQFRANGQEISAVIKTYKDTGFGNREKFNKEVEILTKIWGRSQYFLDYYGNFVDSQNNIPCLNILIEYCPQTLNDLIQSKINQNSSFSPMELYKFFQDLLEAFTFLSRLKIYHQDINPSNIFIKEDGQLKIGNFNVSGIKEVIEDTYMPTGVHEVLGSSSYMAPELKTAQKNQISHVRYRPERADVFSLGLIFYQLATMRSIRGFNENPINIERIYNYIELEWIRKLISGMLNFKYQERFSFGRALGSFRNDTSTMKN